MVSPVNGNGPAIPPDPPPPTNLTEEQLDTLEATTGDLRAGLADDPSRITINAFFQETVESLLDLIDALKKADLQGDRNLLLSMLSTRRALTNTIIQRSKVLKTQNADLAELSGVANDLNDKKREIDTARMDYNTAVDDYLAAKAAETGVAQAETDLINARDAHNQAINDYNALVAEYQGIIDDINAERVEQEIAPLEQTNALPIVRPFSQGVLIDFDPTISPPAPDLTPPIDLNPPQAIFGNIVVDGLGDDYAAAFNTFIGIRDDLNALIDQINAAGDPITAQLRNDYNALVASYNTALTVMEDERIAFNSIVPDRFELSDPGINEENTIDPNTTTPLGSIFAEPPEPNLDDFTVEQLAEDYISAVGDFEGTQNELNLLIGQINAAGDPITSSSITQYNDLVAAYNDDLTAMEEAKTIFNNTVPEIFHISDLMIDPAVEIDGSTTTPLDALEDEPPIPQIPDDLTFDAFIEEFDTGGYEQSFNDFTEIKDSLNDLIDQINSFNHSNPIDESLITTYNLLVSFYNNNLTTMESERIALNNVITDDSNDIPELMIDPEDPLASGSTPPVDSINATPPFPPYTIQQAVDNFIEVREELNSLRADINAAGSPIDDINLLGEYNSKVNDYNDALGVYESERNDYNLLVAPFMALEESGIEEELEIDENEPLPLTRISATPPTEVKGIGDDYQDAFNEFIRIREDLNTAISLFNSSGEPLDQAFVDEYNILADSYNEALGILNNEINLLNSIAPEGAEIPVPGINELIHIDLNTNTPLDEIVAEPPPPDIAAFFEKARDNYNDALASYLNAKDTFNVVLNDINDDFNDPAFDFETDYDGLRDLHNNALGDYNAALSNLIVERDEWNSFVNTHVNGANKILFDHAGVKEPLPLNPADIPPPLSDVSVLEIDIALNQFTVVSTDFDVDALEDEVDVSTTGIALRDIIEAAFEDRDLLSLIFLSRGQATSEIYEPTATSSGSGTSTSAQGGSLASIVLGLSSPRLAAALSEVNVSEAFTGLFEAVDATPPSAMPELFQNITTSAANNASLASTQFALKMVAEFLEVLSPESFPVNLAAALGVSQALSAISNNGGFSEITRSVLSGVGSIAGLPNDNREALFDSVGNLAAFTLVFAAAADLGNVVDKAPELALGTLALNLSFGISGTQLSLREAVKSIKNVLGKEQLSGFQQNLADAFADTLAAGGIAGDDSKTLAVQLASGVLSAEDPESILREIAPEEMQVPLANLAVFASFSPEKSPLESLLQLAGREGGLEAIENRFNRRGIDEGLASVFNEIAGQDQSALRKVAQLQAQLGPEAMQAGFGALKDMQIASSLNQKLKGELDKSDAQSMIKEALTSIHSLDNTQTRVIEDFVKEENYEAIGKAVDEAKELFKEQEKPSLLLSRLQEPTKAMLHAASSIMGEGTLSPSTGPGMKTYPASASREIDFRV